MSSVRRVESLNIRLAYQKEFTTQPSRSQVIVLSIIDVIEFVGCALQPPEIKLYLLPKTNRQCVIIFRTGV